MRGVFIWAEAGSTGAIRFRQLTNFSTTGSDDWILMANRLTLLAMDRREALKGIAAMLGASLLPPIRAAIANGMDPVNMTGATLFSDAMREDTAALADVIIPTTDTPGAAEAGVGDYIEFMLQHWYPEDDRERYIRGMNQLDAHVRSRHGEPFSSLTDEQKIAVVSALQAGQAEDIEDGGSALFQHAKQLTLTGYYSSEVGMTQERHYLPVPGRYDGAYPYGKVGTLFSS